MCRHIGYLGPPRTLHRLVYEGPHSLEHQSYAPRMTAGCLLNADGFGVGWYPVAPPGPEAVPGPVRFRRAQPIWTDVSFREVAGVVEASCAVAAVRSATVGFPVDESCAQPFRSGPWLFSHNGVVDGFGSIEVKLRELAGDLAEVPDARAPVDSALLFALATRSWRSGASLAEGLAEVVTTVAALTTGRYNLLASDGRSLAATTWGDTLFVRIEDATGEDATGEDTSEAAAGEGGGDGAAITVASEPSDDDSRWERVPDRSVLTAGPSGVRITPL